MVRKDEKKDNALQTLFEELLPPCVKSNNVHMTQENTAVLIWYGKSLRIIRRWLSNQDPIGYSYMLSALLHPFKWSEIAGSLWDLLKVRYFEDNSLRHRWRVLCQIVRVIIHMY